MGIDNLRNKLLSRSIQDKKWIEEAKYRKENKDWLDISFGIAVKMFSKLNMNKKIGVFPKNQTELAKTMNCSPQYINKLLKGSEKLNIETISKIQKALKITIIAEGYVHNKVEIVAQPKEVFVKPKKSIPKNYKIMDGIIHCNFTTTIGGSISNHKSA